MFTFHVKLKEVICKVIAEQPDDKAMCAVLQSQGIREAHQANACISRTTSSCQSAYLIQHAALKEWCKVQFSKRQEMTR